MARPGAGGEYADPCVACQVAATLGNMLLDALVRTSPADAPLVGPARTLLAVARKAEAAGVALLVLAPRSNGPVRLTIDLLDLGAFVPLVASAGDIPTGIAGT